MWRTFTKTCLLTMGCLSALSACVHSGGVQTTSLPSTWEQATLGLQQVEVDGLFVLDISTLLEIERRDSALPALAAALIEGDRIVAIGATGERRAGTGESVSLLDLWHLGSLTKSMTATLTATLIEEGLLTWETTVGEVFQDLIEEMDPEWATVSVFDLSRHLGGAPEPNLLALFKGRTTELPPDQERFNWVRTVVLPEPPTTRSFRYTNGNYILLGAVLESLTGRAWQELLREKLFEPLGLNSAGFGAPKGLNQPWGHLPTSHTGPLAILPGALADNPPVLGPAGTVHMSMADLARYAKAHLDLARGQSELWAGTTFERLHDPPKSNSKPYASGWVVETDGTVVDGRWLHHNGTNGYWLAKVGIAPDADRAMVCASNFFDVGHADTLCENLFRRLAQWSSP
jgi:D-alanyl-D-alanine carboxypeptidase